MTHIPVTWKEEHEVIKVHCQPNVERGQESVLVAGSDRYKALQRPSGIFWVRFNVPPPAESSWKKAVCATIESQQSFLTGKY